MDKEVLRAIDKFNKNLRNRVYNKKDAIMMKHKEEIYGVPPSMQGNSLVPDTGQAPNMDLIDALSNIQVLT